MVRSGRKICPFLDAGLKQYFRNDSRPSRREHGLIPVDWSAPEEGVAYGLFFFFSISSERGGVNDCCCAMYLSLSPFFCGCAGHPDAFAAAMVAVPFH
jgi:hypothetical protein